MTKKQNVSFFEKRSVVVYWYGACSALGRADLF
jgi:hypothetical protein